MNSVLIIGQMAMSAASDRAAKAASDIVTASNQRPAGTEAERAAPQPAPIGTSRLAVLTPDHAGTDQFLAGILELKLAKHAYAAGAAIIRTADEMSKEILRIV